MIVLQELVSVPDSTEADAQKEDGKLSSTGKVNPGLRYFSLSTSLRYSWMCESGFILILFS